MPSTALQRSNGGAKAGTGATVVAHPTIALLRSASLSSAAQQEIERMILDGEIAAGSRLTEAWLSERLGVSRGPIREAFRMLEEAGLVRQEKNRGVFVREIPLEEALEIYDLRAAMDELVGRRLAETITPEQMKTMKTLVERLEAASRAGDADQYHLANLQFHDTLVEFAGNRKLAGVYRRLVRELALFRRRNLVDEAVLPHSAAEHRAILRAIASGNAEQAGRVMYDHVMESRERALQGERARTQPLRARRKA